MDRDHRTPSPLLPAVSAAPAVDIPQLLRQATAEADQPLRPVLEISLCGADSLRDPALSALSFDAARVHQTEFQADPIGVLTNPGLVFRDSAGAYVQGEALVLSLVSQLAFGQPLPGGMKAPLPAAATLAGVVPESNRADLITAEQQEPPQQEPPLQQQQADSVAAKPEGRRWWRWGQRSVATQATTQVTAVSATATPRSSPLVNNEDDHDPADTTADADIAAMDRLSLSSGAPLASGYLSDDGKLVHPMVARRHVRYAKTLRLTSAQLKSLNLRRGANDIKFLVPSNKAYCEARIYLYRYDTQIVISDIDGTITKSDALGHLFNMVGKDWTHPGVAKLYTDIANNGYEILYLTSRAIGQADGTRYFITNVKQAGYKLPLGPLLLSPDRLFTSFHREVIMKRPHEFKMACLRDIKNLFGEQSPFYAGFGNRITDAMSYRSVNVPVSRICTIDTTGEIKLDLLPGYKSSYVKMNDLVDMMFPALSSKLDPKFNDWEYWRPGLPSIDDELAEIEEQLAREAVAANVLAADATTAIVSNNATVANATPAASNNTSIVSRRLPPNALAVVHPAVDDLDKVFPALSTSPPPPVELAYSANDMADSEEEDANIIDDEDEDEEDYIDQDMLDMMHDMEEVQRLQ
ncbi:lipin Ned1 [Coemansia sp. RSA 2320]|nr:lipin Ned1 [Coemansia sp. RSA 2320]